MSRQVVSQQIKGLDLWEDVFYYLKNPKEFDKANEAARKEAALTDQEQKKADEARLLIQKSDADRAELAKRELALKGAQETHEKNVQSLESDRRKFDGESQALIQRIAEHKVIESQNNALKSENQTQKATLDKKMAELVDREKKVADLEKSSNARAEKIINREKALELREKNL